MNFRELNNLLIDARAGSHAAECHGFLCGYFCLNRKVEEDTFRQYLFAEMMDTDMLNECSRKLDELAAEVIAGINSENFTLDLLLPDDNCPLNERSAALAEWCDGFLSGLGIACHSEFDLLSAESLEVIQDLYRICRMDINSITEGGEDEEAAFVELTEYVRMGAMLLHEELQQTGQHPENSWVLH